MRVFRDAASKAFIALLMCGASSSTAERTVFEPVTSWLLDGAGLGAADFDAEDSEAEDSEAVDGVSVAMFAVCGVMPVTLEGNRT